MYFQQDDGIARQQGETVEVVVSREEMLAHPVLQHNERIMNYLRGNQLTVKNLHFSLDHRLVSICFDTDISQGLVVKDMVKGMTGFFVEDVDNFFVFDHQGGLFYVTQDRLTKKGKQCFRAAFNVELPEEEQILYDTRINIGQIPVVNSELIYAERDPSSSVEVSSTLSGQYILIKSDNLSYDPSKISVEFRYRASNRTAGDFLKIQERKEGINYDVKQLGDHFYLLVSSPEEYNGKILSLPIPPYSSYFPPSTPAEIPSTSEILGSFLGAATHTPHNPKVYIEHIEAYEGFLVQILTDTDTSLQYIQVDNFVTGASDIVAYDKYEGQLKVANNKSYRIKIAGDSQNYYDKSFRYLLSTLHSPEQIISYDLETRTNTVLDHAYFVPEVRIEDYTSERIVLPANDGEMIPVTIIYHKKNVRTGDGAAAIVHSFGGNLEGSHNFQLDYTWYSALDRGYMWVIPHVRGSFDVNRPWYERGVQLVKPRHFQDLLDVIVSLASEKIARGVSGYSHTPSGGLALMALVVKEPELLSAVVCRVRHI